MMMNFKIKYTDPKDFDKDFHSDHKELNKLMKKRKINIRWGEF